MNGKLAIDVITLAGLEFGNENVRLIFILRLINYA